jgi:hypothetical protein
MNEMAMTVEHLVVIDKGRLIADTGLQQFIGPAASLEEAFVTRTGADLSGADLTGGAR